MPRAKSSNSFHEVTGLLLLGLGLLLFLALVSYRQSQIPRWVPHWAWLSRGEGLTYKTGNFVGPLGAILACALYNLFGTASYLLAAAVLCCGGAKLILPALKMTRRAWWAM